MSAATPPAPVAPGQDALVKQLTGAVRIALIMLIAVAVPVVLAGVALGFGGEPAGAGVLITLGLISVPVAAFALRFRTVFDAVGIHSRGAFQTVDLPCPRSRRPSARTPVAATTTATTAS